MKKIETGKGASQLAVLYRYTFLLEVTVNRKVWVPSLSPPVYHHRKIKHICYSFLFLPIVRCLKVLTSVPKESTFSWFCFFARRTVLPTHAQSLQSSLTLCNLMDCSLPSFSLHAILQARILEWGSMPFSRGSSPSRDQTRVSCIFCIAGRFFTTEQPGNHNYLIPI